MKKKRYKTPELEVISLPDQITIIGSTTESDGFDGKQITFEESDGDEDENDRSMWSPNFTSTVPEDEEQIRGMIDE